MFGAGPAASQLVLVGEQPGDQEDREGTPFVGPAGRVLDRALERAEIDPGAVYRTNVVKHFKFSGTKAKRRIRAGAPSGWASPGCTRPRCCESSDRGEALDGMASDLVLARQGLDQAR